MPEEKSTQEKPAVKRGDVVFIKWFDSQHLSGWQYPPVVLEKVEIRSAGIVTEACKEHIVITTAVNAEDAVFTPLLIPMGAVFEVKVLRCA